MFLYNTVNLGIDSRVKSIKMNAGKPEILSLLIPVNVVVFVYIKIGCFPLQDLVRHFREARKQKLPRWRKKLLHDGLKTALLL